MKNFKEFLSESITINGDFNGTLNVGGSSSASEPEQTTESYFADIVWEGKIYRLEIEGSMPSKNKLTEQLQDNYPGAVVHNIYPILESPVNIKNTQRYRPERLSWSD